MIDRRLITRIEEASFASWPALDQLQDAGWLLRAANGHSKRANSVNPIYPAHDGSDPNAIETKIDQAEAWFSARGLPAIFRLTPLAEPADLDRRLAARAYRHVEPSIALFNAVLGPSADAPAALGVEIRLDPAPDVGWLDAYLALAPLAPFMAETLAQMLALIRSAACFGWIHDGRTPLAAAFATVEGGLMGSYNVVTAPAARRRGLMRALLGALTQWARDRGAIDGALFVVEDNTAARRLYQSMGYRPLYGYHYRVAGSTAAAACQGGAVSH